MENTKEAILNELNKSAYLEVDHAYVDWRFNSVVCEVINTGNRMQDEPDRYLGVADLPQLPDDEGRYCLESIEQLLNPSRRDNNAAADRKELYELFEHLLNTKENRRAAFRIRESAGASGNPFEIIDLKPIDFDRLESPEGPNVYQHHPIPTDREFVNGLGHLFINRKSA